jgi:hypothetical protein
LAAGHIDEDGRLLAGVQAGELADVGAVSVAVRDSVKEVADGADPRLIRRFREFRANSLQCFEGDVEDARAGPVDGGVAQVGRGQLTSAGEGPHGYWAASSHHQLG